MSRLVRILSFVSMALCLSTGESQALTLGQAAQIAQTATPAAFNSIEMATPVAMESHVPQWHRAKSALEKDMSALQACLSDAADCAGDTMQNWRHMVLGLRHQDQMTQMNTINQFFNQFAYTNDQQNYGTSEYWAGPVEFMAKSGDCEDYAIAKYVTMKFLGYTDQQMRIMAVVDNSRGGIGHAVLSVATNDGSMILDNQAMDVYNNAQQIAYTPRFAVNETGVYTYAVQPQMMMASVE